jgi:hypothetical protein
LLEACNVKLITALNLFGGTVAATAKRLDITTQAVHKWDDEGGSLPRPMCDRCVATWLRLAAAKYPELRVLLRSLGLSADALRIPKVEEEETV